MYASSQYVNEQIIINEGHLKFNCFFKNYVNIGFFGFSHLACRTLYACIYVVITLVSTTKLSIMKLKSTLLNRMWQHDFIMKQKFFSSKFLSENTGQVARQAGYPGHDPWHAR